MSAVFPADGAVYIVILAGGHGARFWPVSRSKRPKQFLALERSKTTNGTSHESLIQTTARRVNALIPKENLVVVTNHEHTALVKEHLSHAYILSEPVGRNTAASIGLAATYIKQKDPHGIMVVLPSDHAVSNEDNLRETLRDAIEVAESTDFLVTIGIPPTFPHTGYGYIQRGERVSPQTFRVQRFFEKPNLERAQKYCSSGEFYWNSGMFVWKADLILKAIDQLLPNLASGLKEIERHLGSAKEQEVLQKVFPSLEPISIDFGILEHWQHCAVVEAKPYGWNDIGSWDAWAEQFEADQSKNLLDGDCVAIDATGCIVHTEKSSHKRFYALLGVDNLVVIDSGDAVLVCRREHVQEVKKIVDHLKKTGREDLT